MAKFELMTDDLWAAVRGFSKTEKWGDPLKMSSALITALVNYRGMVRAKWPTAQVVVHCGWETGGHAPNSMHYQGLAADLHVTGASLFEALELAVESNLFNGIGSYPAWSTPGIHVDMRSLVGKPDVFWIEPKDKKGTGEYVYFHDAPTYLAANKPAAPVNNTEVA